MDAGERDPHGKEIFDHGITKVSIPGGITDQSHISCRAAYFARNVFNQRASLEEK
jgi:hypothetical protein